MSHLNKVCWRFKRNVGPHEWRDAHGRRQLQPGEVVEATEEYIAPFADKFERIEAAPDKTFPHGKPTLVVMKRDGGALSGFDVVAIGTGKVLNDQPLTWEEAVSCVDNPPFSMEEDRKGFVVVAKAGTIGKYNVVDLSKDRPMTKFAVSKAKAEEIAKKANEALDTTEMP